MLIPTHHTRPGAFLVLWFPQSVAGRLLHAALMGLWTGWYLGPSNLERLHGILHSVLLRIGGFCL